MNTRSATCLYISAALACLACSPALAQGWGGAGWGGWRSHGDGSPSAAGPLAHDAAPSGHVDVESFRSSDALPRLGHGRLVVSGVDGPSADLRGADEARNDGPPAASPDNLPAYEAAVVDALIPKGYDTRTARDGDQIAEVAVSHDVVVPAEERHSPVSGTMAAEVSNRGSAYGIGINIDLSKPKKAIIAVRMDVRIRDAASGRVLWEGHAIGQAREGDAGLDDGAMATRLAKALFSRFPEAQRVVPGA